jgi:hypothetical protein
MQQIGPVRLVNAEKSFFCGLLWLCNMLRICEIGLHKKPVNPLSAEADETFETQAHKQINLK